MGLNQRTRVESLEEPHRNLLGALVEAPALQSLFGNPHEKPLRY